MSGKDCLYDPVKLSNVLIRIMFTARYKRRILLFSGVFYLIWARDNFQLL
jgi:hypothetical protein